MLCPSARHHPLEGHASGGGTCRAIDGLLAIKGTALKELDLSWTQLGKYTQISCEFLADIIGGYTDLQEDKHPGLPKLEVRPFPEFF